LKIANKDWVNVNKSIFSDEKETIKLHTGIEKMKSIETQQRILKMKVISWERKFSGQ
jgi:hypothetical protein